MALLLTAFALFVAFALCAYRAVLGPQKSLARVGLGAGAVAVCLIGLAYPKEHAVLLIGAAVFTSVMVSAVLAMVVTSLIHWWHTTPAAHKDA